jgi:putative tricarboxylic transport membrane protein
MRALRADATLAAIVIVVAVIYLVMDSQLPSARIGDPLGPKAFPCLVGGGLILSALLLFFETWKKRRALADSGGDAQAEQNQVLLLLAMVAWTALYYFCFERLGYPIATPLFLLGLLSVFNRGRHGVNLAVALGFTAVVYLLFSTFLGVPMPTGPLPI